MGVSRTEWKDVAMFIPAVAPSRLSGCGIIHVSYVLKVRQTFASLVSCFRKFLFQGFDAQQRLVLSTC